MATGEANDRLETYKHHAISTIYQIERYSGGDCSRETRPLHTSSKVQSRRETYVYKIPYIKIIPIIINMKLQITILNKHTNHILEGLYTNQKIY